MPPTVKPVKYIAATVVIIAALAAAVILLQRLRPPTPTAVFYDAIGTSLSQPGLTCTVAETTNEAYITRNFNLDLESKTNIRSVVELRPGPSDTSVNVTTEQIDTATDTYVRYISIDADKPGASGQKLDFSDALNAWSKSSLDSKESSMFGRTALGNCVVPMVHIPEDKAGPLLRDLKQGTVFKIDFAKVTKDDFAGESVYVYDVAVQPAAYVDWMKRVGKAYGLKDLELIGTETYASYAKKNPEQLTFFISVDDARIFKIDYAADKSRSVTFTDYGTSPNIRPPKDTVSSQELLRRIEQAPGL